MREVPLDFVTAGAAQWSEATAIADRRSGEILTYSELDLRSRALAERLLEEKTRAVASRGFPTQDHLLLLISALRAGIPVFPISPRWPRQRAQELAAAIGAGLCEESSGFSTPDRHSSDRCSPDAGHGAPLPSCATILATSGSSGRPKLVLHALVAHLASARASQHRIPVGPGCGWLLNLSPSHVSGLSILFRCLLHGATIVLPAEGEFEEAVRDPRVTHLSVVSTQLARLLASGVSPDPLRAVLAGGGHIPVRLVNAAITARYPIHLTYGMTEAASQITTGPRLSGTAEAFSLGSLLPGTELRTDEEGRLMVRSRSLCLGYLREEGGIQTVTDDEGWFTTGDLGRIDGEGLLRDLGRADRMFISGGENIHPETIERVLEESAAVRRAVVLPIPDPLFGERPVAFVCWSGAPDADSLRETVRRNLPGFMVPVRFLDWLEEVDVDPGKIPLAPFRAFLQERHNLEAGSQ
jgi:O-succinylbenzoic acid--CoA ligase